MSESAPTLTELAQLIKAAASLEISCMMPGVIVKYAEATGLADVQPAINVKPRGALPAVPRALVTAPVVFPSVGGFSIEYAPLPGDPCILLFADRSLDVWVNSGGVVDAGENSRHALKDAIVLPFAAKSNTPTQARITISPTGDITIDGTAEIKIGAAATEAAAKADALIAVFDAIFTATIVAVPQDGGAAIHALQIAAWEAAKNTIAALKTKVQ